MLLSVQYTVIPFYTIYFRKTSEKTVKNVFAEFKLVVSVKFIDRIKDYRV